MRVKKTSKHKEPNSNAWQVLQQTFCQKYQGDLVTSFSHQRWLILCFTYPTECAFHTEILCLIMQGLLRAAVGKKGKEQQKVLLTFPGQPNFQSALTTLTLSEGSAWEPCGSAQVVSSLEWRVMEMMRGPFSKVSYISNLLLRMWQHHHRALAPMRRNTFSRSWTHLEQTKGRYSLPQLRTSV